MEQFPIMATDLVLCPMKYLNESFQNNNSIYLALTVRFHLITSYLGLNCLYRLILYVLHEGLSPQDMKTAGLWALEPMCCLMRLI